MESDDASRSQDLAGTPRYMAPERFEGWSDRRSDVYALGLTLYEMATLSPAFPARDRAQLIHQILHEDPTHPRRLDRRIPHDLETIIRKAMAREPAERYRSADELAEDLENFLAHRPIRARRNTLTERAWKWCRRKPALAGLWLVLALGLAGTSWQWWRAERSLKRTNRMAMGLALDQALAFCQQGEPARGMLQMVELLRSAPSSAPEYEHAIRANLTAWARRIPRPIAMRRLIGRPSWITASVIPDYRLTIRENTALVIGDRGIQVWDLDRLEPKVNLLAGGRHSVSVALCPDARVAITAADDGTVETWDVETCALLGPRMTCSENSSSSEASGSPIMTFLSPDGKIAARVVGPETVRFWDSATGAPIGELLRLGSPFLCAAFSPDGKAFATIGTTYQLWETATGMRLVSRSFPQEKPLWGTLAFRPDGKVLATGSRENSRARNSSAQLWDVATGLAVGDLSTYSRNICSICFSSDGRLLGTIDDQGTNCWWDAAIFRPVCEPFWDFRTLNYACAAFLEDGKCYFSFDSYIYTSENNTSNYIIKWIIPNNSEGDPVPGFELNARLLTVRTPDGKLTVTGSNDGTVVVRDAMSQIPTGPEMRHRDAVQAVAISADGQTLVTGSADTTARLWDLRSGRSIGRPLAHRGPVRSVAFRGDGKVVATGSDDGTARLWDAATGTAIGLPLTHLAPVEVVAFDDDGSLLTRGPDRIVRRWKLPEAAKGDLDRLLLWIQALTGAELTPEGVIRKIPSQQLNDHRLTKTWSAIVSAREQGVPPEP